MKKLIFKTLFLFLYFISSANSEVKPIFEGNTDALQGSIIYWNEKGEQNIINAQDSGFFVFGDAREINSVKLKNGKKLILVAQNQGKLLAFEKQ